MRERRANSTAGNPPRVSEAVCWMMFDGYHPSVHEVERAWANHAERNCQRVRLAGDVKSIEFAGGRLLVLVMNTKYGPVHGNSRADHRRKAASVAAKLGGTGGIIERIKPGHHPDVSAFMVDRATLQ